MIEGSFIEDEDVGQGGEDKVNDDAEEPGGGIRSVLVNWVECGKCADSPCDEKEGDKLPAPVVPGPLAHVCELAGSEREVFARGHILPGCRRECGGKFSNTRGDIRGICGQFGREKRCP